MLAAERKLLILELVNRRKFVKVVDLSRELKITEVTVRRDLEELDEQKKVRRVHGGAIAISLSLIHICVEQLVYFIQYNEELTADELMIDIEIDRYKISGKGSFLDASDCVSSEGTYTGYCHRPHSPKTKKRHSGKPLYRFKYSYYLM